MKSIQELNNKAADLFVQIREMEKAIAANPTGYFEEIMAAELPTLKEECRLANRELDKAREGMQFNTFTDDWEPIANASLVVHQAYRIGTPFNGSCQWRIAFLCPVRGIVEIHRLIPIVTDEFEQAALVRAAIAEFRNQQTKSTSK